MAQYETVGDKQALGKTPQSSPSSNPGSGKFELVGDTVSIGRTPIPSPSADPSEGERQIVGDKAPLNRTPVKGWGSAADTPMSKGSSR